MEAMDAAHHEGNDQKMDLLALLRKVVSLAHKAGKNQSLLKKSTTKRGGYQIGYLQHAMTKQRGDTSL